MEVRIGYPNQNIQSEIIKEINQPVYSTAIGLMMMGFADKNNNCVEIPCSCRKAQTQGKEENPQKNCQKKEQKEEKANGFPKKKNLLCRKPWKAENS